MKMAKHKISVRLVLVGIMLIFCLSACVTTPSDDLTDSHVFQATITEIGEGEILVAPNEGYSEADYARSIRLVIQNMPGSPEPVVGDVIEIAYNGIMTEEDPPSLRGVERITVIRHVKSGFSIRYELGDEFTGIFTDAPEKANAGDIVEIKTEILFDADIHVYVDGQEIGKTHYDSDYWGYSFIMPGKDVLVTARFYTKDEVWGTTTIEESELREKFPEYFDLPTAKGLEVYVWQMAPNSYFCGVMGGTNRVKTLEEMMGLKGASIDEMKAILSTYNIPKENIVIIPWQNPISSFLGEYWISLKDEDPDSSAKRRQEYVDMLREKLLDDEANL